MPDQAPRCDAERQVAALQRDGLLLIAYLAERPDHPTEHYGGLVVNREMLEVLYLL